MDAHSTTTITLYDASGRVAERHEGVTVALRGLDLALAGPLRRRIPLTDLTSIASEGDDLVLGVDHQRIELALGDVEAETWADGLRSLVDALAPELTPP
jgi:hypothetical protein